jgi:hypothetical protein
MSFEENLTHLDWLATWKLLHAESWRKYAGEANEKLLLEAAQNFRACITAFDRSFHQNQKSFTRTDGRTADDDARDASQRQAAHAEELETNVVITKDDIEYAMSLSPVQLVEAYRVPDFARKYRRLIRDHGFKPVPVFAKTGGPR